MTVRSEGQFNTVVYEEADIYRGQERRDVILLNRADIACLGLHVDQAVTVRSEVGCMSKILVREYDIRAGNALMCFPEANVLVPVNNRSSVENACIQRCSHYPRTGIAACGRGRHRF
jgi:hypothetical protein